MTAIRYPLAVDTPVPAGRGCREAELAAVLERVNRELRGIEALRGPEHDVALGRVEAIAAPYALAFFYEIGRLDELLAKEGIQAPTTC